MKLNTIYHIENVFYGEKTGNEVYKEFVKRLLTLDEIELYVTSENC